MKLLCLLSTLFFVSNSWTQSIINLEYSSAANEEVYIGYHYGDKQYIMDTISLDSKGKIKYEADEVLSGGVYMIVYPQHSNSYSEFLWDGKKINLKVVEDEGVPSLEISNNAVAEKFSNYMAELAERRSSSQSMNDQELKELNNEVQAYIQKEIDKNSDNHYGKMLGMLRDPIIPESIKDKDQRFYYYRSQYLKNIPFNEDWILRTPTFWKKIDDYLEKMTVKHHDSIIQAIDYIVGQLPENTEIYKFGVIKIFNKYVNSKLMSSGNVYVHMASKYYLSGKAFWIDEEQKNNIEDRYLKMKYNVLGARAVDFKAQKKDGSQASVLENAQTDYTILFFWDADCGHCEDAARELKAYYSRKPEEVTILGIHTNLDKVDDFAKVLEDEQHPWQDFQLFESTPKIYYDIYSTPVIYVLDKDKKIIAKRLEADRTISFVADQIAEAE